ncbi:MAG: alpha-L-glutamate ligase [Phycisphaerae bacterium]|nr:alpha-L-glutamate ligase [Phycisphaerae bacterium]
MKVYIINENSEWLAPLGRALDAIGVPWDEWYVDQGSIDLDAEPPEGIYFNRMSPSSYTRGHTHSVAHTRELLQWLESRGRKVFNGSTAFELEMSKVRQHQALRAAGIRTPKSVAVIGGREAIFDAARGFPLPFIIKPSRGGRGQGVRLITSLKQLVTYLSSPDIDLPPDDVLLLQEYIRPVDPVVTRVEFVGGEFVYAIRAQTSDGFELCPSDACSPCDAGAKFSLREGFSDPIIERYRAFLRANAISVCGIEFVEGRDGRKYTYDINSTTNYNPQIEAQVRVPATQRVAALLGAALARERQTASRSEGVSALRKKFALAMGERWGACDVAAEPASEDAVGS